MISFMPRCLWQLTRSFVCTAVRRHFRLHMKDQHTASRAQNKLRRGRLCSGSRQLGRLSNESVPSFLKLS